MPSFNSRPQFPDCGKNVCHTAELPFVFHTPGNIGHSFTPEEEELSDLMVAYWTGFAKHLNPNPDSVTWPAFSPDSSSLVFVTPVEDIKAESGPPDICAFWDGIGYDLKNSFWGLF